jgi:sec-independent protein translocase protein TatA
MVLAGGPFGLGAPELILILAVVVVIFGGTKLADLGGSLGKGIKEFKANVKDDEPAPAPAAAPPAATIVVAPASAPITPQTPVVSASAPSANAVQAIQCPSCHTLNPMGSKHCNQCGTSLAAPVS